MTVRSNSSGDGIVPHVTEMMDEDEEAAGCWETARNLRLFSCYTLPFVRSTGKRNLFKKRPSPSWWRADDHR
jgi:hypothetical protein